MRSSDDVPQDRQEQEDRRPGYRPDGVVYANQAAMDYSMPVLERKATATPMAPAA